MEAIRTLDQLSYNLSLGPGIDGYNVLISSVELSDEELDKVIQWNDDHYQRIRIYDTTALEALLTCWRPGQKGPIHNYRNQQGWIKVLRGQLQLDYYKQVGELQKVYKTEEIEEGDMAYLNDNLGFHRFSNPGPESTVALHFYSDKLESWEVYDELNSTISEEKTTCNRTIEV